MARKSKSESPATLDVAALAAQSVEADVPAQSRIVDSHKWDDNPFVAPLSQTGIFHAEGKGRQVVVAARHARDIVGGIRNAAEKLTKSGQPTGVRVILTNEDDGYRYPNVTALPEADGPEADRNIVIVYAAKERRRSLDADQTAEAVREGFVNPETNRVQVKPYLDWVAADRPREAVSADA